MDLEFRAFGEVRAAGRTLAGIAAPVGKSADIGGMFSEQFMPGAFRATLAMGRDIPALVSHRQESLLGRTRSGTLRLQETPNGLEYAIDLPDTSLGRDVQALAARGDLGGVSVAFTADEQAWPDARTRQLRAVTLHEVSILTGAQPAYSGTTIALRSRAAVYGDDRARLRRALLATL